MEIGKKEQGFLSSDGALSGGQEKQSSAISVRSLCLTAVMAAFICIMTLVPRIPIPLGYAHLGDAALFLAVLYVGRREGAVAASIGSAFADFLGGFSIWIIPTLFIKYIMAELLWKFARPDERSWKLFSARTLLGFVLSGLWMAAAYTSAGAALYGGIEAGLTSTPGLLLEAGINIVAAYGAAVVLDRTGLFHR